MFDFFKGERKFVSATLRPKKPGEIAVITKAKYELFDADRLIEKGSCKIKGDTAEILLETDRQGCYTLKMTFTVGLETIIGKTIVAVRK